MARFKDIYTKLPTDINYLPLLETDSETQIILQQIKMILGTKEGDVLGSPSMGLNLKQYLFSYSLETAVIRKRIIQHLARYVSYDTAKYDVDVDVKYGKDHENQSDYALIDISINQQKLLGIVVTQ